VKYCGFEEEYVNFIARDDLTGYLTSGVGSAVCGRDRTPSRMSRGSHGGMAHGTAVGDARTGVVHGGVEVVRAQLLGEEYSMYSKIQQGVGSFTGGKRRCWYWTEASSGSVLQM